MLPTKSSVHVLCLLGGFSWCLTAQTGGIGDPGNSPGTTAQSYSLGGLDSINYYNGHVNISIPIRTLGAGGRGSALRTAVLGIDREWTIDSVGGSYSPWSSPEPDRASTYALGSLTIQANSSDPTACPVYNPNGSVAYYNGLGPFTTTITWSTGNGTQKVLYDVALNGQQQGGNITDCSQRSSYQQADRGRVFRSADSTDTTFITDADVFDGQSSGPHPAGVLILRDGTRFRFGADGFLTQIEDRNGNLLQISFTSTNTGGIYSVQDSLNSSEDINFTECLEGGNCANNPDTVDAFQYHGSNGSGREAHVNYALLSNALAPGESIQTYQNLFPELNGSSASSFNPYIISSVIFPDGSGYTMQYNACGEVARLTLPTGGYYTYRYPEAPANTGSGVIGLSDGSYKILRRVLERDEYSDGATLSAKILYVYSGYPSNLDNSHSSRPGTVTEVSSENSGSQLLKYEQHYFSGDPASSQAAPADQSTYAEWWRGLEFFSYVQDGNQILREKNTVYGQRPCEAGANCWVDPQSDNAPARDPQVCQVNTTESDGSVSSVVMAYDQFNNMTDKYEYDYGAAPGIGSGCPGTPGGWKRHTFTVFRNDSQYLDPNVHIVGLPGDTHVYNQNNQAVAYYHWSYDDYNDRPLQDAPGIVAHDGAYGTGFNARGNNTTLWRAEDGTNVSILVRSTFDIAGNLVQQLDGNNHSTTLEYNTDSSNNYAFPTKVTNALNQPTTAAYDYSTGKAGWTMDFTGTVTYQDYDSNDQLDRLTGVRIVSGGNLLQQTTYSYPDPRTMITRSDLTSPGDSLLEVFHLTDGLGRQYVDRTFENASQNQYIETYTGFDALGRVSATANPTRPGDNLNYLTTYSYDALGRIKSTQKPDGSVATVSYSGNSMTATDEAGKARRSYYDALGRLTTVQEDPNGANQFTNYGYDALDNLTSVNQSGQTRTFSYDGLSRLRSATNPESGTTSYTYDGANNLLTKTDGRNTTVTYGYDVINRMTSKSSSDGTVNSTVSRDDVNRQTTTTSPTSNTFMPSIR